MQATLSIQSSMQKNRDYLPVAGVLFVCVFLLGFAFVNTSTAFRFRSGTTKESNQVAELESRLSKLQALQEGSLADLETTVFTALPDEKPVFDSLEVFSKLAEESEIVVSNLESRPGSVASQSSRVVVNTRTNNNRKKTDYEKLLMNLETRGDLNATKNFMTQILSTTPLMELNTVKISGRSSSIDGLEELFQSELELEVYWQENSSNQEAKTITNSNVIEELSESQIDTLEKVNAFRTF